MIETEIKILGIDRKDVEEKLAALGAVKVFDDEMYALYYDFPGGTLGQAGLLLRLRKEGEKSVLTMKKNIESREAKIKEEHETEVSDFNSMKYLLETLGLKAWTAMKKRRTSYALKEVHFEIDVYQGEYGFIPQFLEIEGQDIETLYAYAALLGFGRDACKPWDIIQVAAYYSAMAKGR